MDRGTDDELRQRAANAYIVWPLAVLELFRSRDEGTAWSRLHARQALVFGVSVMVAYVLLMALPFIVTLVIPPLAGLTTAVVVLYSIGLFADIVGAFVVMGLSLMYRERALRGELFAIPYVTAIADRVFRLDR